MPDEGLYVLTAGPAQIELDLALPTIQVSPSLTITGEGFLTPFTTTVDAEADSITIVSGNMTETESISYTLNFTTTFNAANDPADRKWFIEP